MKLIATQNWGDGLGSWFWGEYHRPGSDLTRGIAEDVAFEHVERNLPCLDGVVIVRPADSDVYEGSTGYQAFVFDIVPPEPQPPLPPFTLKRRI